jgi:hypothetical protein
MSEVFRLCDDYVTRSAALDPVAAGMRGLSEGFGAATDYGPDGSAAQEELIASTLAALGPVAVTSEADRLAAAYLRERLEAQLAGRAAAVASHPVRAGQLDQGQRGPAAPGRRRGLEEHRGAARRDPRDVR